MIMFTRDVLFSRMIGLVSEVQLDTLKYKTVAIPGCGGTGFTYAECMARMGVGKIKIADADHFGPENMNRQFGCTIQTVGLKKSDVLKERLESINPDIIVEVVDFIDDNNIVSYLDGVDVVCDTLDFFVIKPRRILYQTARENKIPVVICCPVAFGVTSHIFTPESMSFEEYFNIDDSQTEEEQLSNFGNGLTPDKLYNNYCESPSLDFNLKKVSSLSASCLMATAYGSHLALMLLLNIDFGFKPVPNCYQFDIRAGVFKENIVK